MRLTRQSKARAVSSMNAGVTDAPPLETSRTDDTSAPPPVAPPSARHGDEEGRRPGHERDPLARHEAERLLGVEAPHQHRTHAGGPGTRTPLSSPEMWAMGAGMSTASAGPRPCTLRHERGLPAQPAVRVQHRLGDAGRAGGEQDQRHVGGPAAATGPAGTTAGRPATSASAAGSEMASGASSRTSAGSIWASAPSTSAAPKEWSTGAATAPMRQQARVRTAAARLFGTCHATAAPCVAPRWPQAAGDGGDERLDLRRRRAACRRRRSRRRAPR